MTAPANEEQLVESQRQREAEALVGRERTVTCAVAAGFLAAAGAMALFLPTDRSPSLLTVAALIGALTLASLVDFEVGSGQAVPLELAFVPMLFVLPAAWVPLAAAAAYLLVHLVNRRRRRAALQRMPVVLGSAWYAVGPALVLALAGEPAAAWGIWPVLLLAFAAQIACDATSAILQERIIFGTPPRQMVGYLRNAYAVDAVLAPLGLAAAIATASQPALAPVVVLPLTGLFAFFAKERRVQMDQAIKLAHAARDLSGAYRRTALLLGDVVEADDSYTGSHSRGVVDLVRGVAIDLGLDGEQLQRAEFTALLHDVGKIAIPKEIINKPGALDPHERAIVETHTIEGERCSSAWAACSGGRHARALVPRALGRRRLPRPAGRRGHPADRTDRLRLRRLQRDDDRSPVPQGALGRRGARRAAALRGRAVRPGRDPGARRGRAAAGRDGGLRPRRRRRVRPVPQRGLRRPPRVCGTGAQVLPTRA